MTEDEAKTWLAERVSRETLGRLEVYEVQLQKWQRTVNLVASNTLDEVWSRHFVDSAQLFEIAPQNSTQWLDLGSGGGFPGLVVAAMGAERDPKLQVTMVESDIRKCGFLREVARQMGLSVHILSRRIGDIPKQSPDVISARALSGLSALFEHVRPQLGEKTCLLFPKGGRWREEVETLPKHWQTICEPIPSVTNPDAVVLRFHISELKDED